METTMVRSWLPTVGGLVHYGKGETSSTALVVRVSGVDSDARYDLCLLDTRTYVSASIEECFPPSAQEVVMGLRGLETDHWFSGKCYVESSVRMGRIIYVILRMLGKGGEKGRIIDTLFPIDDLRFRVSGA